MKKYLLILVVVLTASFQSFSINPAPNPTTPDEGMWLPLFIERLNYVDMQKMGLRLTADELYSINNSSLKDAIVSMGFFCTGELVSAEGLMFTNHHCGYSFIQAHSSIDHNYLDNGFWALNKNEELPNEGLSVSFLVKMDDVTAQVLEKVKDNMTEDQRDAEINKVIKKLKKDNSNSGKYEVEVKDFFEGNEYYMFIYQTYKDVRLVGAPPSSIGKFGGDTDNWMWPRHTGDFSIFRIYTAPDGSPAEYSKDNVPLKSKHFLPISIKGVEKGDFSMVWGYPGTTDRYLTSFGVKQAIEESNPTVVAIRDKKLSILREDMDASKDIQIKYASKYAESANYWKYFIGQTKGLKRLKVYDKKKEIEAEYIKWANSKPELKTKYGNALNDIQEGYAQMSKFNLPMKYIEEAVFQGPEIIMQSLGAYSLYMTMITQESKKGDEKDKLNSSIKAQGDAMLTASADFFKDYNLPTDKKVFAALLEMYYKNVPKEFHPYVMKGKEGKEKKVYLFDELEKKYKGDFNKWAESVYATTIFADKARFEAFAKNPTYKVLSNDPGMKITEAFISVIRDLYGGMGDMETIINKGNRLFVDGLRQIYKDKKFYPNANSTMRMSYGQILDYFPQDAVHYNYLTTLKGIIEKEDPKNDEFIVDPKLKKLYESKDYGRYGKNGTMYVCFLANLDISGGNSGSPVMNGKGELIGLAFDGNWEAMSGDIAYEPDMQRTICVDARYVLFIIDKLAGAKNIINELKIVE